MEDEEELDKTTQISLHSVRNLLGSQQQMTLFSENKVKQFAETYGVNLEREISRYGIDLTDTQTKMMEAILFGLTETNYRGNLEPIDTPSHAKEKYPSGSLPSIYQNFTQLPKLKVTQSELLNWANINQKSAGDVQNAIKALKHLGTTQYCFYYTRSVLNEKGDLVREKNGEIFKEEVTAVDTLFTIKEVRSKKTNLLDYYEIIPSSIFLDQRDSYFMLIPFNWREEVRKLIGQRKASSYTFRFLILLRYQFELERRAKKKQIVYKCSPEEMAIRLKMPESVYKRKKDRLKKILDEVYSVAKKLGYLSKYERTGILDILYLNEEKYYMPRYQEKLPALAKDEKDNSPEMKKAKLLLDLIIMERRKLVPSYNPVLGGQVQEQSCNNLMELLARYSFEEIESVIVWGIQKPYWCNRIGTAANLRKNFEDALTEMRALAGKGKSSEKENREYAAMLCERMIQEKISNVKLEVLNKYVEIADGSYQPTCIDYSEKGFKDQLENALKKRGFEKFLAKITS